MSRPRKSAQRRTRLTREGRYYVAISIGIGLAAINTGNNLLYLMLGWLLSLIVASGVLATHALRGLVVTRRLPAELHVGRPFDVELSIASRKRAQTSYSIELEDMVEGRPVDKRCYVLKVPAGKAARASYRHTFSRRGRYRFDGVRLATRFPFSLFEKSRRTEVESEVIVFPRVSPIPAPAPRARHQGEVASNRRGRHGEFFGLREFRDGDDRRSIHWRSTARSGRLLVREYEDEAQRRATLIVDNALPRGASEADELALESAIAHAASLASSYAGRGFALRLVARDLHLPFGAGKEQLHRIMKALALLEAADSQAPFGAEVDARGESVLVVPRGVAARGRPAGPVHVVEAP